MYLVLGFDKVTALFAGYNSYARYTFTAGFIFLITLAWYAGPYCWLDQYDNVLQKHICMLECAQANQAENKSKANAIMLDNEVLKSELKTFSAYAQLSGQAKLFSIITQAENAHLCMKSCSYQYEKEKDYLFKHGIGCSLVGSFEQLMNFLMNVQKQQGLLCKEFLISRQEDQLHIDCLFETVKIKEAVYE
jgi:hypothetical protein